MDEKPVLTPQQSAVLRGISEGDKPINIARTLGITKQRASQHVARLTELGLITKDEVWGTFDTTPEGELALITEEA